jgi:uncharacterized membrane protein
MLEPHFPQTQQAGFARQSPGQELQSSPSSQIPLSLQKHFGATRAAVGATAGVAVGATTGVSVGGTIGASVGGTTGASVGDTIGASVGGTCTINDNMKCSSFVCIVICLAPFGVTASLRGCVVLSLR